MMFAEMPTAPNAAMMDYFAGAVKEFANVVKKMGRSVAAAPACHLSPLPISSRLKNGTGASRQPLTAKKENRVEFRSQRPSVTSTDV
jgi:hypothetical protein